eukprot:2152492-Prymnesium_polylepis.1
MGRSARGLHRRTSAHVAWQYASAGRSNSLRGRGPGATPRLKPSRGRRGLGPDARVRDASLSFRVVQCLVSCTCHFAYTSPYTRNGILSRPQIYEITIAKFDPL